MNETRLTIHGIGSMVIHGRLEIWGFGDCTLIKWGNSLISYDSFAFMGNRTIEVNRNDN